VTGGERLSRRALLRRGGTLALVASSGSLTSLLSGCSDGVGSDLGSLDAGGMQKCISLGGPGPLRSDNDPDDYRLWGNREYLRASHTKWVKLWVSWMELQQELGVAPQNLERSWQHLGSAPGGQSWLRRLDAQVRAANDDDVRVIVTLYHAYPTWSSGATGPDPADRTKPPEQHLPGDLSPSGPWAWFIAYLCARYRKGADRNSAGPRRAGDVGNPDGAVIDALEIVNEPNLLLWPARAVPRAVARMIDTADLVSHRIGGPVILAPGTSDFPDQDHEDSGGTSALGWYSFTGETLLALRGFRPRGAVYWSQHNFNDVKRIVSPSRAEQVLGILKLQPWVSKRAPLWLTEGGYNIEGAGGAQGAIEAKQLQAKLIADNFNRMRRVRGIHLWTQHTITDKAGNDFKSGLRDDFIPGQGAGAPRPAWQTWKELPD
jgi:hypothetical protein